MIEVSLTEARARLPELLTSAAEGEEIHILRHGRSVGVLVGHARWVKTQQHDVLIQARELRRMREAARGKWNPSDPPKGDPAVYDRILRELEEDREADRREMWVSDAFDSDVLIRAANSDPFGDVDRAVLAERVDRIGSVVLLPETMIKPFRTGATSESERLTEILATIDLKPVDEDIADASVTLGAKYRLRAPDAIHLATAVIWGAERFYTHNTKDFGEHITEIDIVIPGAA